MGNLIVLFLVVIGCTLGLTVLAESILIPILRSHKLGQKILDIGPQWHKSKEGTPIMGGLGFILAILFVMLVRILVQAKNGNAPADIPLALTIAFGVANGIIGFIDDYAKLVKKQNEGLNWKQKLVLQFTVAAAYIAVMAYTGNYPLSWKIPFTSAVWNLGWVAYPIGAILLVGVVNGGNLTDGIDGLFSSLVLVEAAYYAVLAFVVESEQIAIPAAMLVGGAIGFLIFNFHPARVFMGDTGSLFFGGMVIALAFQAGNPFTGLIVTLPLIFEMLSSFLQVIYFKASHGKRLFKMAPFHHHLEKSGWNEYQIVAVFSLTNLLFCVLAWISH